LDPEQWIPSPKDSLQFVFIQDLGPYLQKEMSVLGGSLNAGLPKAHRELAPEGYRESFQLNLGLPEPSSRPFLALVKKAVPTTDF